MALDPIAARHEDVLARLTDAARADERIVAAWLQGSRADGSADAFSDLDYYVAIADEAYDTFDPLTFIEPVAPVLVYARPPGMPGVVCLLEGPVKLDFSAERRSQVAQPRRPAVRVLLDKEGVAAELKTGWAPSEADVAKIVDDMLRITFQGSMWPVRLLRRGQWMSHAFSELVLVHSTIVPLLLVVRDRRAFHRNQLTRERLLTDEERLEVDDVASELLRALAGRSLPAAQRAHLRILDLLGRAGRRACEDFGLEYPEAAEQEARRFYEREWPA